MSDSPLDPAAVAGVGLGVVPKQRRGIEVRDRLYAAAIEEFGRNGVEGSRVESIVAAAGTSWGTFFRYFPRKEDVLLHGAALHFHEYVFPSHNAGLADPGRSVRSLAEEFFEQMMTPRGDPRLHAEMLAEGLRHPPRFSAVLGGGELPVVGRIAALMERGQEAGEVRAGVPALTCATVLTAGVVFSTTPVLRAVAAGHLPASEILAVAQNALGLVWGGISEPELGG